MNTAVSREVTIAPLPVPAGLQALLAGCQWLRNQVGEAGADVFRVIRPGGESLYLKRGREDAAIMVAEEMGRLNWLSQQGTSLQRVLPKLVHFEGRPGEAWLLTTAMPGRTAYEWLENAPERAAEVVQAITQQLKALHAMAPQSCPFTAGPDLRIALARQRLEAGFVDADDFDDARAGWTPEDVWQTVQTLRAQPALGQLQVVTHGDYSLDNLLLDEHCQVTGLIDLGRLGLADPYQDLAILWNCLGEFGANLQQSMWAAYGIQAPDDDRLQFHLCLDEMF